MPFKPVLFFCILFPFACSNETASSPAKFNNSQSSRNTTDKNPFHSINTIPLPEGYVRTTVDSNSFAAWLRQLHLKENKTVYLYDGNPKLNQLAQFAVLDISVGNKNLQQCADAVMRLKAEYLFSMKKYEQISFTDNEKTLYNFTAPYSRDNFTRYMERVFGMCGSASLSKQLRSVSDFYDIQPGDVLIRGGFPGHAAIVLDVAENTDGKKIYMLAQSYMPAQDIHILINPSNDNLSPWYEVNDHNEIYTPEYLFYKNELKRW